MNAVRWTVVAVLAAVVTVAWVLPTVVGPSVTCINIDPVDCDRAWRAKASEGGGLPFMPVVKVTVWGSGTCTSGQIDWALGGLIWSELCA